jgi:Protein of unknown function (DUF3618)
MESQSARLEREVEEARWQLSGTLEELRGRMTAGRVVDQFIDYTRDSPAGDFFRNLGREIRENPLPLVVIGVGITWLLLASNRTSRAAIAAAADNLASKAEDIGTATGAFVSRTTEWGQQTAARAADRATDVAGTVGDKTAEIAGRARDAADGLAEKARSASAAVVATFERAKRPFTGASEDSGMPARTGSEMSRTSHNEDAFAVEPAYERR